MSTSFARGRALAAAAQVSVAPVPHAVDSATKNDLNAGGEITMNQRSKAGRTPVSSATTEMASRAMIAALFLGCAGAASAQSLAVGNAFDVTRSSSFTYYQAADGAKQGLLQTETVEPNDPQQCVTTTYTYDSYGNRAAASIASCAGATTTSSFATHGSVSVYAAVASQAITVAGAQKSVAVPAGAFATSASNALNQGETRTYDPRFGAPLTVTGPNQIPTYYGYDDFGRKTREKRVDGTSVVTYYCLLSGNTTSNSAGCAGLGYAANEKPADAYMVVHVEPHDASDAKMGAYRRVFSDAEGRTLRVSTESFDGASQPTSVGTVIAQDTIYSPQGAVIVSTQPYFLATRSSTLAGAGDVGATYTQYDLLGRPLRVYVADPQGSQASVNFGGWGTRTASRTQISYTADTTVTTDDLGRQRTEEKDLAGNVVRATDAAGAQLARQYDAFGSLVQTKDALQDLVTLTYDARGRKLSMSDPDSGITVYCYDALGQLKAQQTAKMRGGAAPGACPSDIDSTTAAKAEANWTTLAYDVLGRLRSRTEPELVSTWSYDTYLDGSACAKGIGKMCESRSSIGSGHRYAFDGYGRIMSSSETTNSAGTAGFATSTSYEAGTGRVATKTYPTGLRIAYGYTSGKGFLNAVSLVTPTTVNPLPHTAGGAAGAPVALAAGTVLWQPTTVDAWGHSASDLLGNAITDRATFDASTGRVGAMVAGAGSATNVENLAFAWDSLNRLTSRTDNDGMTAAGQLASVVDSYQYDSVDRLTQYAVQAPAIPGFSRTVTLQYNAIGNLLYKSDVGTYAYAPYGNAGGVTNPQPHAVATVTNNLGVPASYQYDASGNLTSSTGGKYGSLSYTSFNLPDGNSGASGHGGQPKYTWVYDENHQRILETRVDASGTQTTWFAHPDNAGGLGFETEISAGGTRNNRHYITAGSQTIVIVTTAALPALAVGQTAPAAISSITAVKVEYWHKDSLGNLVATTDQAGAVTARYAYDPFGKRRYATGVYDASGAIVVGWSTDLDNGTGRGYTTHEHLDDLGIIHMNGRLFDPTIGRFMQADPLIQSSGDLQNYNRYSYCLNNPVTCTDPSGQSFLGNLFSVNPMRGFLASYKLGDPLGYWINSSIAHTKIGYEVGSIAIAVVSAYYCEGAAAACDAIGTAAWAGFAGQNTKQALRAGVIAGVTAELNYGVGSAFPTGEGMEVSTALNTLGHAAVGCASARMSGGSCESGAASGFVSAAWSNYGPGDIGGKGLDVRAENTAIHATVSGIASVAGGGSFSNGAMTGAFDYLFNQSLHRPETPREYQGLNYLHSLWDGVVGALMPPPSPTLFGGVNGTIAMVGGGTLGTGVYFNPGFGGSEFDLGVYGTYGVAYGYDVGAATTAGYNTSFVGQSTSYNTGFAVLEGGAGVSVTQSDGHYTGTALSLGLKAVPSLVGMTGSVTPTTTCVASVVQLAATCH